MHARTRIQLVFAAALVSAAVLHAQSAPPPPVEEHATPAELNERSWSLLTSTVTDTKHVDTCIQGLAALGTMGNNPRAAALITGALKASELDIRTAAILAAGQTKNSALLGPVREALDDPEPAVAFTAATTLWKMHDYSGEDVIMAVATGERRANATMMRGTRHRVVRDLHSPMTLAKLGASQGAGMLLGPFGIGLSAIEYARKNGGDSARASSIELLADQHSEPVHKQLLDALDDKDPAVRAAAAKGLGQWPGPATGLALEPLLLDSKLPVRLTAAAAYLRSESTAGATTARKGKARR